MANKKRNPMDALAFFAQNTNKTSRSKPVEALGYFAKKTKYKKVDPKSFLGFFRYE